MKLQLLLCPLCQVISIESDDLVLEAFRRMRDNQVGGLPVVEGPRKEIVGNVSIRDIRHLLLKPELFSNFRYSKRHAAVLNLHSTTLYLNVDILIIPIGNYSLPTSEN